MCCWRVFVFLRVYVRLRCDAASLRCCAVVVFGACACSFACGCVLFICVFVGVVARVCVS